MNRRMFSENDPTVKTYATVGHAVRAANAVVFKDARGKEIQLRYVLVPAYDAARLMVVFLVEENQFYLAADIARMGHCVTT